MFCQSAGIDAGILRQKPLQELLKQRILGIDPPGHEGHGDQQKDQNIDRHQGVVDVWRPLGVGLISDGEKHPATPGKFTGY